MSTEAFEDVLRPGEKILVSLGAPRQSLDGASLGWAHIALTEERVLVAEVSRDPGSREVRIGSRVVIPREEASLDRYPRSESGPARLEIHGFADAMILVDLDRPELFTQLRPFLAAWRAPIGGDGPISLRFDSLSEPRRRARRLTRLPGLILGLSMGIGLGLFILWAWV